MDLDQASNDIQAHAGPVGLPGRGAVPLGERFEQLADRGRIEVRARVADPQNHLVPHPAGDEPDRGAGP